MNKGTFHDMEKGLANPTVYLMLFPPLTSLPLLFSPEAQPLAFGHALGERAPPTFTLPDSPSVSDSTNDHQEPLCKTKGWMAL